ncbi:hypothetical protein HYPSUDRAFT_1074618 [Hypholoma sublateritium FD-334 SS-4]|uniref:Uncharacterized protein n=1 Tax=Hypholoma sublateritium (strain FD-334 SS-4) TaxID=945553 RepID=A0A0D2KH69_HYPSF|nr:hypothetical protein HYPSUDRAFT_1074618 [Hypholoma sublateritium FD-334 SS-4]
MPILSTMPPTTNVTSIATFATTTPPPPPLVVPIDLTDLHNTPATSVLDLEDLDPARKPSDDPIRSTASSTRFRPYNTRERPKTAVEKGKRRADSSPLSSVPPSPNPQPSPSPSTSPRGSPSPTPRAGPSSAGRQPYAVTLWIPRPKNATRQNLETLLGWNEDEYKEFRAAITLGCRRLLDSSRSWQAQDAEKLSKLREEILGDFLQLQRYQDAWPFEVAVQATLKSSAAASKKKAT